MPVRPAKKRRSPRRLARLTPAEDRAWAAYFGHYVDSEGRSDSEADRCALTEELTIKRRRIALRDFMPPSVVNCR
jgi:hypothetical protein